MDDLPDFGAPLGGSAFASAADPQRLVAVPDALVLATHADGVPRITLERYRGENPDKPPGNYGLVSLEVALAWPSEVDGRVPARLIVPDSGVLDVRVTGIDGVVVSEPLPWDGTLSAPWGPGEPGDHHLADLRDRGRAAAHSGIRGRRRPRHRTAPARPGPAGLGEADPAAARRRPLPALLDELATPAGALAVEGAADPLRLAETLLERLPAAGQGTQVVDLAQPQVVRRTISVTGNLAEQIAAGPIDPSRNVPAGVVVPALDLGWVDIDVLANLPGQPVGVLACGVNLTAPPNPPARHQAASGGTDLTAGRRHGVTLRLAPGEPLSYRVEPWLVLATDAGVVERTGPVRTATARRLTLNPTDFGVGVVGVSAERSLLEVAEVEVTLTGSGAWQRATLTPTTPPPVSSPSRPRHPSHPYLATLGNPPIPRNRPMGPPPRSVPPTLRTRPWPTRTRCQPPNPPWRSRSAAPARPSSWIPCPPPAPCCHSPRCPAGAPSGSRSPPPSPAWSPSN
ncbi:MAG: hypothetical protein HZY73_13280 [Micropruina sp.]|nr:MAG: hypothetical protein HZY73_13280 [Micropruina sp.]